MSSAAPNPVDQLKAFVINLPRHATRRAFMEMQCQSHGLNHEIFDGVEGAKLAPEALAQQYDASRAQRVYGRELTLGEVGCALSHLAVYREIVDRQLPFALILEDDALIGNHTRAVCRRLLEKLSPDEPTVVLLIHTQKYTAWGSAKLSRLHRLVRTRDAFCGHAYVVTQAAARALLDELTPVHAPADCWNALRQRGTIQLLSVVPYCVGHSGHALDSSIEDVRRTTQKQRSKPGLLARLHTIFYRKFLYQLVVKPLLRIKRERSTW